MNQRDIAVINSMLGEDFLDVLEKSNVGPIAKPDQTAIAPEEIKIALQIVPRAVLSFLFANLKYRTVGEPIELDLPFAPGARLYVNKKTHDNYSGEVVQGGRKIAEFRHRALPAIGLILLTTFELYDMELLDELKNSPKSEPDEKVERLQDLIDERLTTHRLIQDVVDKRISEREAISKLIQEKLNNHIMAVNFKSQEIKEESSMENNYDEEDGKKSRLRQFLEERERRREEPIEIDKSEIACPDCGTSLHKSDSNDEIKLCICYGDNFNKSIKYGKDKDGKVRLKFPKSFEIDNIEMLLDAIKNK